MRLRPGAEKIPSAFERLRIVVGFQVGSSLTSVTCTPPGRNGTGRLVLLTAERIHMGHKIIWCPPAGDSRVSFDSHQFADRKKFLSGSQLPIAIRSGFTFCASETESQSAARQHPHGQ